MTSKNCQIYVTSLATYILSRTCLWTRASSSRAARAAKIRAQRLWM